jgi:hypothetical protein
MQLNNSSHTRPADSLDWLADTVARGESIIGRLIREHREREAAAKAVAEARRTRIRRALIIVNLVGWPAVALAAVELTQAFLALGQ